MGLEEQSLEKSGSQRNEKSYRKGLSIIKLIVKGWNYIKYADTCIKRSIFQAGHISIRFIEVRRSSSKKLFVIYEVK